MVDTNPTTSSITAATFFPYHLAITDVASRFFVPLGWKDKTADSVFQALQEWATSFGPNAEFSLYMLTHVHIDFDSAFTSLTLKDVVKHNNKSKYPLLRLGPSIKMAFTKAIRRMFGTSLRGAWKGADSLCCAKDGTHVLVNLYLDDKNSRCNIVTLLF
jgi:hypothetical protein